MIDGQNIRILDLYSDESGGAALTESRYRFFLTSSILLTPDQKDLADCFLINGVIDIYQIPINVSMQQTFLKII